MAEAVIDQERLLGLAGMVLVFASFIVRRWVWLYAFNLAGTLLLTIYAILIGDPVFTVVEAGIALFLAYRLLGELRSSGGRLENKGVEAPVGGRRGGRGR